MITRKPKVFKGTITVTYVRSLRKNAKPITKIFTKTSIDEFLEKRLPKLVKVDGPLDAYVKKLSIG